MEIALQNHRLQKLTAFSTFFNAIFPSLIQGVTFNGCDVDWCATSVDADLDYIDYGDCGVDCPIEGE